MNPVMNGEPKNAAFQELCLEIEQASAVPGFLMTDILTLPEELRQFLSWVLRQQQASLAEIASYLEQDEDRVSAPLALLVEKGYLEAPEESTGCVYRARTRQSGGPSANLAHKPRKDLLALLGEEENSKPEGGG